MSDAPSANAVLDGFGRLPGVKVHEPADDLPHGLPLSSSEYDDMPVHEFTPAEDIHIFAGVSRDGHRVSLDWLEAVPRGGGHGAAVLRSLLDLADVHDAEVVTIPKGGAPSLVALYERHGFVVQPSGEKWLYRPGARPGQEHAPRR